MFAFNYHCSQSTSFVRVTLHIKCRCFTIESTQEPFFSICLKGIKDNQNKFYTYTNWVLVVLVTSIVWSILICNFVQIKNIFLLKLYAYILVLYTAHITVYIIALCTRKNKMQIAQKYYKYKSNDMRSACAFFRAFIVSQIVHNVSI